jgi:hypothetical protein
MFNQIVNAFQGFFSRSFWFASFLPVAVIAALHIAIAELAFPGLIPVRDWLAAGLGDKATGLTVLVAALVVLAYALAPLTPLVRDMLDGRALPYWLHNLLRAARVADWQRAKNAMAAAMSAFNQFDLMYRQQPPKLADAAKKGNALGRVSDVQAIRSASAAIRTLQIQMQSSRIPDVAIAKEATAKLIDALERNASNLADDDSKSLTAAKELFIALIADARMEADYHRGMISSTHRIDLLPTRLDLLPTRVGDARRITERYSEDTYQVDFDYIWTRIQTVLPAVPKDDTGFLQRLSDAQSQVSFSVLALLLTFTVPVVWLPILLFTDTTPWLFLTIGVLSPALVLFLYELVVQSQSVFGEVVRAAIDKYRLDVLTDMMRQPLPTTLAAERALWRGLALASAPRSEINASLVHKSSAQKS